MIQSHIHNIKHVKQEEILSLFAPEGQTELSLSTSDEIAYSIMKK